MSKDKKGYGILQMEVPHRGSVYVVFAIVLVAIAVAILYGIFLLRKMYTEEKRFINLTVPSVQRVDNVFLVAKLSAEKHLKGVNVTGVMINSTALEQKDIKFKISVGDQSAEFIVDRISSGSGRKFEVIIPNAWLEKTATAQIQCLESSISYYIE
ncbi:MAG: hypothetical protein AB1478_01890 [Nitrospirota bacterium]